MDASSQLNFNKDCAALTETFLTERKRGEAKGIYHMTQVEFSYHTNRIEGSQLKQDEVYSLYLKRDKQGLDASHDDIQEALNHCSCFDMVIDVAKQQLDEYFNLMLSL